MRKRARRDLCGGPPVRAVPTATIKVSEFEMMMYGPYAEFTATTEDGDQLPLDASWDSQEYSWPTTLTVWLRGPNPAIYLSSLADFDRALAHLHQTPKRRRKRRNR